MEQLEEEITSLRAEIGAMKKDNSSEFEIPNNTSASPVSFSADGQETHTPQSSSSLADAIETVSLEGSAEQRYVGESSGVHFGRIIQALLPLADYKYERGLSSSRLGLRLDRSNNNTRPLGLDSTAWKIAPIPPFELANRLQETYFANRWPSLPFLHQPTFLERHFMPVVYAPDKASHLSLFLTYMVFAMGAINLGPQKEALPATHLDYFATATNLYFGGLVETDSVETVQGLLLMSTFAINEPQSMNAWMISGLAMRYCIDFSLHRKVQACHYSLFQLEMRKRVFWSAYVIDRNISIALGRPLSLQDRDIDVELPLPLSDQDLCPNAPASRTPAPELQHGMSTFVHIIKLRQIGSKIQSTFYPVYTSNMDPLRLAEQKENIRKDLDDWIKTAPRFSSPPISTFQTMEWFQIAYNHALLLLFRPSPACPEITLEALQTCADSSISLITLYIALYSKNKITYTWVALHSLFMASVTMLYTLVIPEIRSCTTQEVVRSNIKSCLKLFENMVRVLLSDIFALLIVIQGEFWQTAAHRCYEITQRLGESTLLLFEEQTPINLDETVAHARDPDCAVVDSDISGQESIEWLDMICHEEETTSPEPSHEEYQRLFSSSLSEMSSTLSSETKYLSHPFPPGFNMSRPLISDILESDYAASMQGRLASSCSRFERFREYDPILGHSNGPARFNASTRSRLEMWQDLFK